jgi:Cytochrome c554 and c-prime
MKESTRRSHAVVLPTLLLAVLLLGACADSNQKSTSPASAPSQPVFVGMQVCTTCHADVTSEWLTSMHANLGSVGTLDSPGDPTMAQIGAGNCAACHDPLGDSARLVAGYTGNVPRPVIGCESCHGPGSIHASMGGTGLISLLANTTGTSLGPVAVSGQFVMCTACHGLLNSSGTGTVVAAHDPASGVMPTGNQYVITDTHFATPGSWGADGSSSNTVTISGYAMNYASETVCSDCHDPHGTADTAREWAASRHADTSSSGAWAYYNWSCDVTCGSSRTICQRCHTTTGFAAYANALQTGNIALAEAIWTGSSPQLSADIIGFKPEMLECTGCHSDNRGGLRNPGAYNATYPIGTVPNASISYQYPDIAASNVCMTCHTGRVSGKTILALNTGQTATVDFSNFAYSNVDGHYLTAGGTMFKGTAYEYAVRNYADPATYMHYQIGTSAQPGTGTMGPCIGCHMDRTGMPGNHLFEPVSTVTGTIVVTSEVCFKCHAGSSIDFGLVVQDEKDNSGFALDALENQLLVSTPSYSFSTGYPYFTNTNWMIFGDTDKSGNSGGKNTLGAAFNFSLLYHEPGAYVHNSRYVKRLIYDSIDWLDDGVLNYSVGTTLNATCASTPAAWCDGAKSYLLYGAPGTSGERP